MSSNTKVEAVTLNGKSVAIRITFTYENKFYARQYAIVEGMTTEQATKQCYKYRDRIMNRKVEGDLNAKAAKIAQELEATFIATRKKRDAVRDQVGKDVAYVLQRYANSNNDYQYENVYGKQTEKKAPSWW